MVHYAVHAGSYVSVCELKSITVTEVHYMKGNELYFPLIVFLSPCFLACSEYTTTWEIIVDSPTRRKPGNSVKYAKCAVLTQN